MSARQSNESTAQVYPVVDILFVLLRIVQNDAMMPETVISFKLNIHRERRIIVGAVIILRNCK